MILIPSTRLLYFAFTAPDSASKNSAIIEVHKGQGPNDIAKAIAATGAISDTHEFIFLGKLSRQWKRIKAGEYKVAPTMTPIEIFSIITSGVSVPHPVTVREGENMYEIADDIEAKGLAPHAKILELCRSAKFMAAAGFKAPLPPTLEGYLYPDTYFFNRTLTPEDMVRQMVRHFQAVWGKEEETRANQLGLSRHQVVTLASIIEKETGAPQERPMISSVFHNRLKKRMKLQSDPTTIYGMWDRYEGKIHHSDFAVMNKYNTYAIPALPVGPISNPGREAIHAALFPAESPFLYFVSHNDGTHQFSKTFEEHNRAVTKFQLDPKAREGKSWRDLYNKMHPKK
ncbi:MAG: endolytic transglycosylase MltG [Bdellovibrionota bacterium]